MIKRIYDNPEQVIGGFDLDCSRFYMDHNLDIYTTVGGLASFVYKINPINFSCYSASFQRRIKKYKFKGFTPIYLNKKYERKDESRYRSFVFKPKELVGKLISKKKKKNWKLKKKIKIKII